MAQTWHEQHASSLTLGDRAADGVAQGMGSWRFILWQTAVILVWIVGIGILLGWDPYPFGLLTLALSLQAAYAAPFILMSQNRQSDRDRVNANRDLEVDEESLRTLVEIRNHLLGEKP